MQKVKPLKKFGQNYLVDKNILNKIVDEINPQKEDNLVEIGPGTGALTSAILERISSLTAIEIDRRVIQELSSKHPSLNLVEADFLDIDLGTLKKDTEKIRIAGNIPYNLTSPILFKLIHENEFVKDAVLMIQLEVAQRLIAKKGTKEYGILAVILDHFAETKICFKVSPNVFYPKPKVFSAVVHVNFKEDVLSGDSKTFFIKTVKACFGNRRKTLKNSLSNSIFGDLNFYTSGIDLTLRAEQLNTQDFLKLAEFAEKNYK